MKRFQIFVIALGMLVAGAFLLPLTTSAASWNAPYKLGDGGTKPAVAIDSQGNIHYVWWDPTTKVIRYAVCGGLDKASCSAPETLPNNGGASFYPNIAIDPQDRANVVWESKDSGSYSVFWSRRENDTWSAIKKVSSEPYAELPDIAIGPQGIIHVVYQSKQDNTGYVYYVESRDGFGSATKTEIAAAVSDAPIGVAAENNLVPEGQQLTNGLYPRVTADNNDLAHVVWNAPSPYGIYYRIQQPTGKFGTTITVSTGHKDQTPDITFSPNGSVGILWGTYDNFNAAFAEYDNGQADFKKYDVDGGLEQSLWPRVGVDCSGLYWFAFQGKVTADGNWDIFARTYNAATNKFGKRVTIGNTNAQEQTPAIAATHIGAIVYANTSSGSAMGSTTNLGITCGTSPTATATDTPNATATNTSTPTATNTNAPNATATSTATATHTPTATFTPTNAPTNTPTATSTAVIGSGTEHIPANDPRIAYDGKWRAFKTKKATDGLYKRCGGKRTCKKNWSATLNFIGGTRVEWETVYAQTYGKAQVIIDGKLFEQIDLCKLNPKSAFPKFGVRTYLLAGDESTPHTIKIRALGRRSNCSPYTSKYVSVDGFNIVH
jgi:hypothetical protein